jgi:hypothetical protein
LALLGLGAAAQTCGSLLDGFVNTGMDIFCNWVDYLPLPVINQISDLVTFISGQFGISLFHGNWLFHLVETRPAYPALATCRSLYS